MHRLLDSSILGSRVGLGFLPGLSVPLADLQFGTPPVFERPIFRAAFFFVIAVSQGGDFDLLVEMRSHGGDGDMLFRHRMRSVEWFRWIRTGEVRRLKRQSIFRAGHTSRA